MSRVGNDVLVDGNKPSQGWLLSKLSTAGASVEDDEDDLLAGSESS